MRDILHIFWRADGANPWTVLVALLLAGLMQGLGLASLLPLITVAAGASGDVDSPINTIVDQALGAVGLAPTISTLLAMVVTTSVARSLLNLFAMRHVGYAEANVSTNLRRRLIRSLLDVRWSFLADRPLGRIANAMSVDSTRSGRAYRLSALFIANSIQAVIYAVVAIVVSWKLALVSVGVGLAIAGSLHALVRIARRAGWRQTKHTSELVAYLSDALNNVKPLKAMARQAAFANLFEKKVKKVRRALKRQVVSSEMLESLQEILIALSLGVGFFLAVIVAKSPILEVIVLGVLLVRTVSSVAKLQRHYQKAVTLEAPYHATLKLIADAEREAEDPGGTVDATFEQDIRFENVLFGYGDGHVLNHVTLNIPADGVTVMTGPSGGGKTTIVDLILGLYQPGSGRILVDGVDLADLDRHAWRSMIGYVPQELVLFNDTIMANIALGDPEFDEARVREALVTAGAWDFVDSLPDKLQTNVGEKGAKLSGGQRQRIALARAVVHRPRLLILDEVTSSLDPQAEARIIRNIQALSHDVGILAVTHRPAFLEIADRTYSVLDGKVAEIPRAQAQKLFAVSV